MGLRTELLGAFYDDLCHIGNFDPQLANSGKYPFVYGGCANQLKVAGLAGSGNNTTYHNNYTPGLGPRLGFAWDVLGRHSTTVRGGYGIYFVREDVGTVDQLSFQAPILPIAFGGGPAGCLGSFFSSNPLPGCPNPNFNALPKAGVLDGNFLPCLGVITGFTGPAGTNGSPVITCANGSPGVVPSYNQFALVFPRTFNTTITHQWNFTIQRDPAKQWALVL